MKNKETFDNIVSLGYKCETAQSVRAMFGDVDSNLFNWVHMTDIHNFLKFMENPDLLMSEGIEFDLDLTYMYRDNLLGFMYHSKHKPDYFQEGDVKKKIEEDKPEVYSRFEYLKKKFLDTMASDKKNLFVMCFKKNVKRSEINDILEQLSKYIYEKSANKESKLVVVFERFFVFGLKLKKFDNIIIKKTWKFAPDGFAHGINFEFWKNLYSEFNFSFCENPHFAENIENYIKDMNVFIIPIFGKKFAAKDKYRKYEKFIFWQR